MQHFLKIEQQLFTQITIIVAISAFTSCFKGVILEKTGLKELGLPILLHAACSLSTCTSRDSSASLSYSKENENEHFDYFIIRHVQKFKSH